MEHWSYREMNMKKHKIRRIFFLFLFALVLFIKFLSINQIFAEAEHIVVPFGECYIYNNVSFEITNFSMQTLENFLAMKDYEEIRSEDYSQIAPTNDSYLMLVEVAIENVSKSDISVPIYSLCLTDNVWSNGLDLELFNALNPEISVVLTVAADEKITVTIPYVMYKPQFNDKRWSLVQKNDYYLTVSVYPKFVQMETL